MSHADIRKRYLRDSLPIRLGGLAANLLRIRSFAQQEANREAVAGLLDESKHFIEWTAAEAEPDTASDLVALQVQLARWERNLDRVWAAPAARFQMAEESRIWSERVMAFSGLMVD